MARSIISILNACSKALAGRIGANGRMPAKSGNGADVVIRVEGGICSQIAFVALGEFLARKYGVRVKYDLTWFRDCGMDVDGRQVRNWDFQKAFPSACLQEASEEELSSLSAHNTCYDFDLTQKPSPMYFAGYSHRDEALWEMRDWLKDTFRPTIDGLPDNEIPPLETQSTCAVHVRRGDLAAGSEVHGRPTSATYYSLAMRLVSGLAPNVRFFIFTDDGAWARANVLPQVPRGCSCELMEHGSAHGYLDLYLISRCAYIISSIGSLGRFGALLSDGEPTLIMSCLRPSWSANLENVIYLNDDRAGLYRPAKTTSNL